LIRYCDPSKNREKPEEYTNYIISVRTPSDSLLGALEHDRFCPYWDIMIISVLRNSHKVDAKPSATTLPRQCRCAWLSIKTLSVSICFQMATSLQRPSDRQINYSTWTVWIGVRFNKFIKYRSTVLINRKIYLIKKVCDSIWNGKLVSETQKILSI